MGIPRHVHAKTRALSFLALGGLLSAATGCSLVHSSAPCGRDRYGMPTCPVTVKFIESQPEAHLLYPGSTSLGTSGSGQTSDLFAGTNGADLHTVAVTTAPMATVYAWYRTWMAAHGWHPAGGAGLTGPGIYNEVYTKGTRESFVIQEDIQEGARSLGPVVPPNLQSETLYEITFYIDPYQK